MTARRPPADRPDPEKGSNPATPEGRSRGGKVTAAKRQARRKVIVATAAQLEQKALADKAAELAADAARWETRHATLRNGIMDTALGVLEQMDPARITRLELDEDGNPQEYLGIDAKGNPQTKRRYTGDLPPKDYRELTISFGILVDKVRLYAGEATSRTEHLTNPGDPGAGLSMLSGERANDMLGRLHAVTTELERGAG